MVDNKVYTVSITEISHIITESRKLRAVNERHIVLSATDESEQLPRGGGKYNSELTLRLSCIRTSLGVNTDYL